MLKNSSGYTCRVCQSEGPFYEAYLAHSNYLCKACACANVIKNRKQDAAHLLAHRLYNSLRRQCKENVATNDNRSTEAVQRILDRCKNSSVISGEADPNQLCVIPYFHDIPMEEWHCVIVTQQEARSLSHLRSQEKIQARFPAQVQAYMNQERAQHA